MADVSCATCRWWDPRWGGEYDRSEEGKCRARSPRVASPQDYDGVWPNTGQDDWCGEHAPKVEVPS